MYNFKNDYTVKWKILFYLPNSDFFINFLPFFEIVLWLSMINYDEWLFPGVGLI